MKKFIPIIVILILGALFLVVLEFGSNDDTLDTQGNIASNQGTFLEQEISRLKQTVYSEHAYARVSALIGASNSTDEVSDQEHTHLKSLFEMAKCNSLVLAFDSIQANNCQDHSGTGAIVKLMKQQQAIVTVPDMDQRMAIYSDVQFFLNVIQNTKFVMTQEYNYEEVERLKKELNVAGAKKAVFNCMSLSKEKERFSNYLENFSEVAAQVDFNIRKNNYPSQTTTDFVQPYTFYMNRLEEKFGDLN